MAENTKTNKPISYAGESGVVDSRRGSNGGADVHCPRDKESEPCSLVTFLRSQQTYIDGFVRSESRGEVCQNS